MGDVIRFILNGEAVEVADAPPTATLLDWLRARGLTGTKEGCAEGDCGACTVAVRTLGEGGATTRAMNACIQLLPMLHGREVVTVEALGGDHPVQTAMAEAHATQCGFCTPGFVMSLAAAYESEPKPDEARLCDILAGNLCRCTGYGPILKAGAAAYDLPRPPQDDAAARLNTIQDNETLDYYADGRRFIAPVTAAEFAKARLRHPDARILAGATDIGLWVTKRGYDPKILLYVGRVKEFKQITRENGMLTIGAAVDHLRAGAALAALYPDMGELWRRFASTQVRAAGTLCGNIANGSPIGDAPPALIAAGASLTLRRGEERRAIALEDFFIAYGKQDLEPGEFVESVSIPVPADGEALRCHKISKRFDQDISAVMGAFNVTVADGIVADARICFGGMAATPKRAASAEAALIGQPWSEDSVRAAMAAMREDYAPLSDMRASADYRMQVAQNLLLKYWIERSEARALRVAGRTPTMTQEAQQ